ncbi:zinc-dependent alcohol dehydrogenase [Rhabdothermincola sediminis]|uniref:zinc-dependent alcohol dehydrogenase n=1 Tax=Rhabdothermincola sediminis TaxID=2751370 RepID=UPI001AA05999|nr:zinc-binding dehydrogenase [Rhabdothermincola sediminis]
MKALQFEARPARYAAAAAAGRLTPGAGAKVGPLRLRDLDPPELPGPDWVVIRPRLAGICGSDLSTIDGHASRYFEPIVSFPFVPGHEVVADRTGSDGSDRVVVEPVLGCVTRGIDPPCAACGRGDLGNCEHIAFGALAPGLQSGFCHDTGGGWSTLMVAHPSQLHPVPASMSDEAAVMVEPTACAVHAALTAGIREGDSVVVLGTGTLGLLVTAALRHFTPAGSILAVAKHPTQRELARALGADLLAEPDEVLRAVRRLTGTMALGDGRITRLTGGADHVIDCVGSAASLADALAAVRPKGRVTLVGMPGHVHVDLTGLWQREIVLAGAYAYGTEELPSGERRRTFDLAFELVRAADLGRLVSATYPLARYQDAIAHAASAGRRGAVKIAFDLRNEKERTRL